MRRTTVKLPDDLDALLRHEAQRRGVTIADVTKTALERHLGATAAGRSDVSKRIEEILTSETPASR